MTVRPEFGPEYGEEERESWGELPEEPEEPEHEDQENLPYESNEARAPGKVCERCCAVITATQDARLLPDGQWIHEVCPPDPGAQSGPGKAAG